MNIEPTDPKLLEGFHRQRRSLVAVSLVLVAFQGIDPTLSRLELLGNSVDLESPIRVGLFLWVAWLYFAIRYYQYFHDIGDRGIHEAYRIRLHRVVRKKAMRKAYKYLSLDLSGLQEPKVRLEISDFSIQVTIPPPWIYVVRGVAHIDERGAGGKGRMQMIENDPFTLPEREVRGPKLKAAVWVAFHTRLITEYGLPFAVAMVPLLQRAALWLQRIAAV